MWSVWVSSLIIQIHPGMKSLMCWVASVKPNPWEALHAESCWKLKPELTTLSGSNPNSQHHEHSAAPSSHSSHCNFGARGRRQWDVQVSLSLCSAGRAQRVPSCSPWHSSTSAQPEVRWSLHRLCPGWGRQHRVMCKASKVTPKRLCQGKNHSGKDTASGEIFISPARCCHTFVCWRFPQPWASTPTARGADCPGGCPQSPSSDAPPESQGQSLPCASPCRRQNQPGGQWWTGMAEKQRITAIPEAMWVGTCWHWAAKRLQWLLQTGQPPGESDFFQ